MTKNVDLGNNGSFDNYNENVAFKNLIKAAKKIFNVFNSEQGGISQKNDNDLQSALSGLKENSEFGLDMVQFSNQQEQTTKNNPEIWYNENDKIHYVDKYNKNGKKAETIRFNENGNLESVIVYNKNGTISEEIEYYENGNVKRETTCDKEGNRLEIIQYDEDGEVERAERYNETGITEVHEPQKEIANKIADDIYADVSKKYLGFIPATADTLGEHVKQINSKNVLDVIYEYQGWHDESIIYAILSERGLDIDKRIEYITHIKDSLMEYHKQKGTYTEDISAAFDKELKYQLEKFGIANTPYLHTFINKVNRRNESDIINEILNEKLKISKPNGKIDENFEQGNTGDCWLVASIKAIANTPKGLKLLNDSISVDDNGFVTVTLKGVGKTYTISPEELEGNTQFSTGDGDVRAIEIAMDKYFYEERGVNGSLDVDGNEMYIAYKILTGKGDNNIFYTAFSPYFPYTDSQIDNFNKENHVACVAAVRNRQNLVIPDITSKNYDTDNTVESTKIELLSHHAYTVLRSDNDYVYLINPYDTSKEIAVDRETFKDFFKLIYEFDL